MKNNKIERWESLLPQLIEHKFIIMYGKGINDTYIKSGKSEVSIETILDEQLRIRGYQNVLFYSPHRSIYRIKNGGISPFITKPSGVDLQGNQISMANFFQGPLGNQQLIQQKYQLDPQDNNILTGDIHSIRILDKYIKDHENGPNAIIFMQTETILRFFNDQRTLTSLVGEWTRLPSQNLNICVFLFSTYDDISLSRIASQIQIPELKSFINGADTDMTIACHRIKVEGPSLRELYNLIRYVSTITNLRYKTNQLPKIIQRMAVENLQARQWFYKLSSIKELTEEQAIENNFFSSKHQTIEDIYSRLDSMVGLDEIKQRVYELTRWFEYLQRERNRNIDTQRPNLHMIFMGNPGTGKTTIARFLSEILREIGWLERGHLVEVKSGDLIAEYVGGTTQKTNQAIEQAMGGVLFLDEAYILAEQNRGGFGQEAIDTILTRMEDNRDQFVVIAAGYTEKMKLFINSNPGLDRRFPKDNRIEFRDYSQIELYNILIDFLTRNDLSISNQTSLLLNKIIYSMIETKDENFGNAGEMRNFAEAIIRKHASQIDDKNQVDHIITNQDIPVKYLDYAPPEIPPVEHVMKEINMLVGLNDVKNVFRRLIYRINYERTKNTENNNYHLIRNYVFSGNPGTGKTTVARLLGKLYQSLGLLKTGHCIEVSRVDLIAGYLGQSAIKTKEKLIQALDGVLFIDEGYSLFTDQNDSFGKEAIDTIIKFVDLYQNRTLIILAGYPLEMDNLLKSNPGLRSRFTNIIRFSNFSLDELLEIFQNLAAQKQIGVNPAIESKIRLYLSSAIEMEGSYFGNARTVYQLFEDILDHMSERIYSSLDIQSIVDKLFIELDDIPTYPGYSFDRIVSSTLQNFQTPECITTEPVETKLID
jgi:SpoVK/Ycf46/Vps4 family AAA+-type ATPase